MLLRRRHAALMPSLALLAALQAVPARAECEFSNVSLANQTLVGPAAAQVATFADSIHWESPGDPPYVADGSGYLRIALVGRAFRSEVHATNSLGFSGTARDEYRVVGVPAGTEVTFRVRLFGTFEVLFYEYCGGSGCNPVAGMTVDGVGAEHLEYIGFGAWQNEVRTFDRSMTLVRRAGEPFLLSYYVQSGTSHSPAYVGLHAGVEFVDLPAGVSVVSCLEDYLATPSRPTTWGALKLRYR